MLSRALDLCISSRRGIHVQGSGHGVLYSIPLSLLRASAHSLKCESAVDATVRRYVKIIHRLYTSHLGINVIPSISPLHGFPCQRPTSRSSRSRGQRRLQQPSPLSQANYFLGNVKFFGQQSAAKNRKKGFIPHSEIKCPRSVFTARCTSA